MFARRPQRLQIRVTPKDCGRPDRTSPQELRGDRRSRDQRSWPRKRDEKHATTQRVRRVLFEPGIADAAIEYLLCAGDGPRDDAGGLHLRSLPRGAVGAGGRRARIPPQAGRQPIELRPSGVGGRRSVRSGSPPSPRRPALARRAERISGHLRPYRRACARSGSSAVGNVGDRRPARHRRPVRRPQGPPRGGRRRGRSQAARAVVQRRAGRRATETGRAHRRGESAADRRQRADRRGIAALAPGQSRAVNGADPGGNGAACTRRWADDGGSVRGTPDGVQRLVHPAPQRRPDQRGPRGRQNRQTPVRGDGQRRRDGGVCGRVAAVLSRTATRCRTSPWSPACRYPSAINRLGRAATR